MNKTFVWVLKTGVLCEQGSYLHETKQKSCSRVLCGQGLLENCLSCAYKTLAQDPKPLIVPVCTFLLALRIYFWTSLSQPRGTLSLQSPYKTRTRRYTRLRTRPWGAHSTLENSLLALGGPAGYALCHLCWRYRAIEPTPDHPLR